MKYHSSITTYYLLQHMQQNYISLMFQFKPNRMYMYTLYSILNNDNI